MLEKHHFEQIEFKFVTLKIL